MKQQHATPIAWDLDLASRMRETGMTYAQIGLVFGLSPDTMHCRLDAEYRAKRQWQKSAARQLLPQPPGQRANRVSNADLAARLAEIPKDTRDLTAFICGDPIPGRIRPDAAASAANGITLARVSILGDRSLGDKSRGDSIAGNGIAGDSIPGEKKPGGRP